MDNNISSNIHIDKKWLTQEEMLQNIDSVISKESMNSISAKFIYINTHNYIDKVICESIPLDPRIDYSLLSNELLTKIIHNKKIFTDKSKYKFLNCYLCNFNIMPTNVNNFSKSNIELHTSKQFYNKVNEFNDLIIPSSVSIFHDINCIFFYF